MICTKRIDLCLLNYLSRAFLDIANVSLFSRRVQLWAVYHDLHIWHGEYRLFAVEVHSGIIVYLGNMLRSILWLDRLGAVLNSLL